MLLWPLILSLVASADLFFAAPESRKVTAPKVQLSLVIFSVLDAGDLYQALFVTSHYRQLAHQAILARYGASDGEKTCVDYSKVLDEFESVVQAAGKDAYCAETKHEVTMALVVSPHFRLLKFILEDRFGFCIELRYGSLPKFALSVRFSNFVKDDYMIWALPHILDSGASGNEWIHLVRGLIELERWDLLQRVTFKNVTASHFKKLMSLPVPEFVAMAAAEAVLRSDPDSKFSNLLALAVLGNAAVPLPENCRIPLFAFHYLHQKNAPLPSSYELVDGLCESSTPFWTHVFEATFKEAEKLLCLVMMHGDGLSKLLARAYYEPISDSVLSCSSENAVYQSMLIRFNFSPISNNYVAQNYTTMLEGLVISYSTICAFLDCKQYELVEQCSLASISDHLLQRLIDKLYWLQDDRLIPLIQKCIKQLKKPLELLKDLFQRGVEYTYTELVLDSIQTAPPSDVANVASSIELFGMLESLAFDDICVSKAKEILATLAQCGIIENRATDDFFAFDMVVFWEASEVVINYFFRKVWNRLAFRVEEVLGLLWSKKYSVGFLVMLIRACGLMFCQMDRALAFRPDLTRVLYADDSDDC